MKPLELEIVLRAKSGDSKAIRERQERRRSQRVAGRSPRAPDPKIGLVFDRGPDREAEAAGGAAMSVDKWEYIGPYLKVRIPVRRVLKTQDPKCCGVVQRSGKFCSECGKSLERTEIEVEEDAVNQYTISSEINDELNHLADMCGRGRDGFDYWKPNGTPGAWKLPDHEKVGAQEVTAADIERTSAAFRLKFCQAITHIEETYGCRGEVKFGLLVWFL